MWRWSIPKADRYLFLKRFFSTETALPRFTKINAYSQEVRILAVTSLRAWVFNEYLANISRKIRVFVSWKYRHGQNSYKSCSFVVPMLAYI